MTYAPFNLSGKVCLVTGGNRGIGLGMAEALAASNADVAIWGRNAEVNTAAVAKLEKLGTGKIAAWSVDVGEEAEVVKGMAELEDHFGRIDTCIANAGVGRGAANFEEMTIETWRYNQRINSEGAFFTLREAGKSMVKRAKAGDPHTKGGLIAMMNAIATEYGRYRIRANSILPGWIATDMTDAAQGNDTFTSKVISRVPIRRWGEPEDFGGIAVYLASDASSYHSGTTLIVDGAYSKF